MIINMLVLHQLWAEITPVMLLAACLHVRMCKNQLTTEERFRGPCPPIWLQPGCPTLWIFAMMRLCSDCQDRDLGMMPQR